MDFFQWASLFGVGGWVTLIIKAIIDRKKTTADAAKTNAETNQIVTKTATDLLEPLNKQVDFLKERLDWALAKIKELNVELDQAYETIKELKRHVH